MTPRGSGFTGWRANVWGNGVDLFDFDQRLQAVLRDMPAAFRPRLLHVLMLDDDKRARAIGELYREGRMPVVAELLMDLEVEPGGAGVGGRGAASP